MFLRLFGKHKFQYAGHIVIYRMMWGIANSFSGFLKIASMWMRYWSIKETLKSWIHQRAYHICHLILSTVLKIGNSMVTTKVLMIFSSAFVTYKWVDIRTRGRFFDVLTSNSNSKRSISKVLLHIGLSCKLFLYKFLLVGRRSSMERKWLHNIIHSKNKMMLGRNDKIASPTCLCATKPSRL